MHTKRFIFDTRRCKDKCLLSEIQLSYPSVSRYTFLTHQKKASRPARIQLTFSFTLLKLSFVLQNQYCRDFIIVRLKLTSFSSNNLFSVSHIEIKHTQNLDRECKNIR